MTTTEQYRQSREALIAQERARRYDAVKASNLTDVESRANDVLQMVRKREEHSLWNSPVNPKTFPGMPLREAIGAGLRETDLWKIIQKMPKGALLHCHMDGTVEGNWLLKELVKYDDVFHVKAEGPLTADSLYTLGVCFKAMPPQAAGSQTVDIFANDYDGAHWMPLREARKKFPLPNVYNPPPVGSIEGVDIPLGSTSDDPAAAFDAWLHSLMTMTPSPGSKPMNTSPEAWERFNSTFDIIGGFIAYEPVLRAYIKRMVLEHAADGVSYIETRLNFLDEFYIAKDAQSTLDHTQWVEIFEDSLAEAKAECNRLGYMFHDAKIIYATVRFITPERLQWYLDDCLMLKKKFPHRVVGFDLVGYEDPLMTLDEYIPQLLAFQQRAREEQLDLPFIFHAGETLGDGTKADNNLYDAILLGTKRIGHAYSLYKHPLLLELCRERNILIESCPVSNEVLRYTGCVAMHPMTALLNHGVPVALSNDDATQFGNPGLSCDFFQTFMASSTSSIASLYTLVKNSIEHARLTDGERGEQLATFEEQWAEFCAWILATYGAHR